MVRGVCLSSVAGILHLRPAFATAIVALMATFALSAQRDTTQRPGEESVLQEYTVNTVPNVQLADSTRFVSDPWNYLSSLHTVDAKLQRLRQTTGVEAVVVILPSIGERAVEDFALELFRSWGLGSSVDNSGLLLLVVMDQKKFKMEVGYGLEGILPDATCSDIIYNEVRPAFREQDYDLGISNAVDAVEKTIEKGEYEGAQRTDRKGMGALKSFWRTVEFRLFAGVYFFCFLMLLVGAIADIRRETNGNKIAGPHKLHRADKKIKLRATILLITCFPFALILIVWYLFYRPKIKKLSRVCPSCEHFTMRSVSINSPEMAGVLTASQALEQSIGSVRYAGAYCSNCHYRSIFEDSIPFSQYAKCPSCSTRAYYVYKREDLRKNGQRYRRTYSKCRFCGHDHFTDERLLAETDTIAAGAIFGSIISRGGSGGFGGGSSSGGGFGGGSSGGGGATGGW